MQELIPLSAGLLIGLFVQTIANRRLRLIVLIGLAIGVGAAVSYLTGELAVSWGFITVDALLVWLGAALGAGLAAGYGRVVRS